MKIALAAIVVAACHPAPARAPQPVRAPVVVETMVVHPHTPSRSDVDSANAQPLAEMIQTRQDPCAPTDHHGPVLLYLAQQPCHRVPPPQRAQADGGAQSVSGAGGGYTGTAR